MFTVLRLAGENLAAKIQLTQVRASRLRERVNLYLALGGDFKGTGAPENEFGIFSAESLTHARNYKRVP